MSYIKEKVAYLRGLADGLNVQDEAQNKLTAAIIETLDAMADAIDDNEATMTEMDESIDDLYDALDELEEECCACECDDDDDAFDEDDFCEIICPSCGECVYFDQDMIDSDADLICPNCNAPIDSDVNDESDPLE